MKTFEPQEVRRLVERFEAADSTPSRLTLSNLDAPATARSSRPICEPRALLGPCVGRPSTRRAYQGMLEAWP